MSRVNENQSTMTLFILLLCLFISACSAEPESPYTVVDSNHDVDPKTIYWMDNERIIFIGRAGPIPRTPKERHKTEPAIFIWDITKGITKYKDVPDFNRLFCYDDGKIFYKLKPPESDKDSMYEMVGDFGSEKLVIKKKWKRGEPKRKWTYFDCRSEVWPTIFEGRRWEILKEEHGYLDKGEKGSKFANSTLTYYATLNSDGISLPIGWGHATKIDYYEFRKAYFLSGSANYEKFLKIKQIQGWWLFPGGESKSLTVPYVDLGGRIYQFYPTKEGYFYRGGHGVKM